MMKKKLLVMTVMMSLFLTMPALAFGPGSGRCLCDDQGFMDYHRGILRKLNLSDEQRAKMEDLWVSVQREVRPLREKMFDASVELRRLWLEASPDEHKINAAQKEIRKVRETISDKMTSMRLEMRNILTPEQNKKLAGSRWDWGRNRGMGYGPRGGERGPNVPCPGKYF
jgi:Spy/CpxP family protein refolding chaperone